MDYSEININIQNFDSICRFCLKREVFLKPIFHEEDSEDDDFASNDGNGNESVTEMIENCTRIEICSTDSLPKFMCSSCLDQLLNCSNFRRQCLKSDEILKNLVNHGTENENDISDDKQPKLDTIKMEVYIKDEELEEINKASDELFPIKPYKVEISDDKQMELDSEVDSQRASSNMKKDQENVKNKIEEKCAKFEQENNHHEIIIETESGNTNTKKEGIQQKSRKPRKRSRQCQVCGLMVSYLTTHMLTHTGEKKFKCTMCEKSFSIKGALTMHMKNHLNTREYKCDICQRAFNNPISLKVHYIGHTDEKNFICDVCNEAFKYPTTLRRHRLAHFQDRRYECSICHKCFYTKYCLTKHNRTHTGEKPYQCEYCPKRCSQSGSLIMHTKIHTNGAPYKCSVCESSFVYKADLKEHLKSHEITENEDKAETIDESNTIGKEIHMQNGLCTS